MDVDRAVQLKPEQSQARPYVSSAVAGPYVRELCSDSGSHTPDADVADAASATRLDCQCLPVSARPAPYPPGSSALLIEIFESWDFWTTFHAMFVGWANQVGFTGLTPDSD